MLSQLIQRGGGGPTWGRAHALPLGQLGGLLLARGPHCHERARPRPQRARQLGQQPRAPRLAADVVQHRYAQRPVQTPCMGSHPRTHQAPPVPFLRRFGMQSTRSQAGRGPC